MNYSHSAYQYPNIRHVAFIYNQDDVDRLRDYIHDFASKYQFGGKEIDYNKTLTTSLVAPLPRVYYGKGSSCVYVACLRYVMLCNGEMF